MILELLHHITLLVTLMLGLELLAEKWEVHSRNFRMAQGLLLGLSGIMGMLTPVPFAPGIIYDGRSIILTLAGLFGGPGVVAIAASLCGGFRLYLGSAGAIVGTAVVIESAALGTLVYWLRQRDDKWIRAGWLWLVGMGVHLIMLGLQLLLPNGIGWEI